MAEKQIPKFSTNGKTATSVRIDDLKNKIKEIVQAIKKDEVSVLAGNFGSFYPPRGAEPVHLQRFVKLVEELVFLISNHIESDTLKVAIFGESGNLNIAFYLKGVESADSLNKGFDTNENSVTNMAWARAVKSAEYQGGTLEFKAMGSFPGQDQPIAMLTMPGFRENAIANEQPIKESTQ